MLKRCVCVCSSAFALIHFRCSNSRLFFAATSQMEVPFNKLTLYICRQTLLKRTKLFWQRRTHSTTIYHTHLFAVIKNHHKEANGNEKYWEFRFTCDLICHPKVKPICKKRTNDSPPSLSLAASAPRAAYLSSPFVFSSHIFFFFFFFVVMYFHWSTQHQGRAKLMASMQ